MASPLWTILSLMLSMSPEPKVDVLPRDCLPEHYELELDLSTHRVPIPDLRGKVQIRLNCTVDSSKLTVHRRGLFIAEEDVLVAAFDPKKPDQGTSIKVAKVTYQSDRDFLVVTVGQTLKKGSKYTLTVSFSKLLGTDPVGLYRSFFYDSSLESLNWIVLTNLYPNHAHTVFPCFDEPDLKATFNLTLVHDQAYNVLSNLAASKDQCAKKYEETTSCKKFTSKGPIAPFQLAFSINNYDELEETDYEDPTIVGLTNDRFQQIDDAVSLAHSLLEYYSKVLGIEYPVNKLTLITTPAASLEYSGGVGLLGVPYQEDQTLDVMTETYSRAVLRQLLTNYVTLKSWSDLWIVEGLVWYYGQQAEAFTSPGRNSSEMTDRCSARYRIDTLNSSVALAAELNNASLPLLEDLGQKAFCVFTTIANSIGKQNFLQGTVDFISKNHNKTVDRQVFISSFNSTDLSKNESKLMIESWLVNSGVSLLNVTTVGKLTKFQQTQIGGTNQTSKNCRRLKVPLNEAAKSFWIDCASLDKTLATNDSSPLVNRSVFFYSKILYGPQYYEAMTKQLNSSKSLAIDDRVLLIDDVMNFAWFGYVNYSVALKLVSYLRNEISYRPWKTALDHFDRLWHLLKGVNKEKDLTNFLLSLIVPVYKRTEVFEKYEGLSKETQQFHSLLAKWACRLDWMACRASAKEFYLYIDDTPEFLQKVVFREAVGPENSSEWDSSEMFTKSQTSLRQAVSLAKAIRNATPYQLLQANMVSVINAQIPRIDIQYKRMVLDIVLEDSRYPSLWYNALLMLFDEMNDRTKLAIIRNQALKITDANDFKFLQTAINRFESEIGAVPPFSEVLESIQSNLDWLKKRSDELLTALKKNTF